MRQEEKATNKGCISEEVTTVGNWKYQMDILGNGANTSLNDIPLQSEDEYPNILRITS